VCNIRKEGIYEPRTCCENILIHAGNGNRGKLKRRSILSRRRLALEIFRVTLFTSAISWSVPLFAEGAAQPEPAYRLRLYHTHTNEGIDVVYRRGDDYIPSAVARLNSFLRARRTGTVFQLDRRIFDLLHDLTVAVGRPEAQIDIICGYRTPWSSEFLRRTTSGVASNSLHMLGEAIDIRIPGVPTSELRDAALGLGRGGVGFYPESGFVHVDVGRALPHPLSCRLICVAASLRILDASNTFS
jgi:uncharacterized protein YcbK (DUF882 family)